MNERSNATLYFGINADGLIVGLSGERSEWQEHMTESISSFFFRDQIDLVSKCIRPLRFVETVTDESNSGNCQYVIEVDIVPAYKICEEDIFFIKKLEECHSEPHGTHFFRISNGDVIELTQKEELAKFIANIPKLSANRKQREEERRNKAGDSGKNLRVNLQHLLCRGEHSLDGDIFPILVTGGMQNSCTVAEMKANFQFMKHLHWNAILDFDDKCSLFSYLEENEEQVFKVLKVEDFDESYEANLRNKDRLSAMLQDLKTSCHRPWIFVNGYNPEELSPHDVFEWKEKRSEGFKEAVRYLKHDIPRGRAVVVFLLFSKEYDVMLEAADELATKFANQWFTIAPSDEVAEDWQTGLLQKRLVKTKKELIERSVIGLPWKHVNEIISNILGSVRETACELPTSNGIFVKLSTKMQNDWSDLEILSARECDNDTVTQEQTDHASKVEEHFYRGGEVDWWNFYYQSHVLERSCFPHLLDTVRGTLEGKMEEADRVECISLYHQPGAGGTTTAKQVLWNLKDKWRCAVIKQITQQTCQQISRFHSYKDGIPKPVLLLFDNADDERVGALRAELDEQAKQVARCLTGNSDRVFCVFLLCIRKTELIEQIGSRYFRLKHELTSSEQHWFRTKYQELKKKYKENPKHLIGFNILKENFNPEFITKTVNDLLREITEPRERKLLKYVSLLNAYDLAFQSLPASAFNAIMEVNQVTIMLNLQRWELHLSQSLKILLYQFEKRRAPGGQRIRIIHNTLCKQIMKILIQEDAEESGDFKSHLYKVCSDFVDSEIFNMTYKDNSVEQLLKVVRDVVKRRARSLKNGKPETKFALIIEDILNESKQNISDAADLLKKIYELSEDVFVGQQLSRLYIHSMNWEKAKDIAMAITDKKPDNSFLWDTYGHAYKEQIKQIYADCMENGTTMNATDACNMMDLTFTAIHIFQKEQEVSETEKNTLINNAGYYQELQVVIIMLDCLSITEGLKDDVLHQVLVNEKQMPKNLSDLFGENRVFQLSQVQTGVNKALARLEDEHLQLRDDMADDYQKNQQRLSTEMLIKHKETLEHYYGEEKDEVPSNLTDEEACKYRRRRIFRLAGNTFCAVFELRRKMDGEERLLAIRTMINRNMKSGYKNIFDEQMLISVNLTLCCINDRYKKEIVLEKMSKLAADLYKARDKRIDYSLEPYIFAVMFNWPCRNDVGRRAIPAQEIPEILRNWRAAYYKKYPRQKEEGRPYRKKETTVFFLGNGEGIASLAFDQELRKEGIKRNSEQFWNLPHVVQRLERWFGVLVRDGSEVKINITQGGNRLSLQIPTSMPIFDRSLWSKTVYYVIGFTWAGPKAFDIRIEHPTVVSRKEETVKSIAKSNSKQNIVHQRDVTHQHTIYHRMAAEFKELASQLALITKFRAKPKKTKEEVMIHYFCFNPSKRQIADRNRDFNCVCRAVMHILQSSFTFSSFQNALCRKEAEIQRRCEHLKEEIRKAYNDLYTDY